MVIVKSRMLVSRRIVIKRGKLLKRRRKCLKAKLKMDKLLIYYKAVKVNARMKMQIITSKSKINNAIIYNNTKSRMRKYNSINSRTRNRYRYLLI